ncbi:MAG: 4-hydroxythreonine-4-phosphate dehydrogenase PdxA, partial [Kiloniellales bacterium]|nr:4-hydroxythreonine-4-phosphate dehydrogenase PdxA [Kiloniellales bacterium]
WRDRAERAVPPFFLIDDPRRLARLAARLGLEIPLAELERPEDAAERFDAALPVLPHPLAEEVAPGHPLPANGASVLGSIARAAELVGRGRAAAVVTNPIHKKVLYDAGFAHPGHTEYLAELAAKDSAGRIRPVMMLACRGLRVVPVTVHLALKAAIDSLTAEVIVHAGRVTAAALERDFGIAEPRLAVAGLNPHAGEDGALGREELETIGPALEVLRAEGLRVDGPAPADTLFHESARRGYDAALCMYHDQALIPVKTIDFAEGVNITLGLPFVRTSPDHGTALSLAGTGAADPSSLIAALRTARLMAANRAAAAAA